jgi:integrase/recombinase XerC
MGIDEAFTGWWQHLLSKLPSAHTLDRYGRVWRRFRAFLAERGVQEIGQLRPEHLRAFTIALRASGLSETTIHYDLSPLKAFTSWLEDEELLASDPFRKVKRPKLNNEEPRVLDERDQRLLLATYDKRKPDELWDYLIIRLTLETGLRRAEVLNATLPNLNLEGRTLRVLGKGRKWRQVPLLPETCHLLWKYIATTRKKWADPRCEAIFVSRRGGPLDHRNFSRRFTRHVAQVRIPYRFRFHDLRHTAATRMIQEGMHTQAVQKVLGHSSDKMTRLYTHLAFDDVQRMFENGRKRAG